MNRILFYLFVFACLSGQAYGQSTPREKVSFPESDIFLVRLSDSAEGNLELGEVKNVTARPGYENQPFFTNDSQSFLFSQSDDYQTDVFEYFVETGKTEQVTHTPANEFSPTPSPDNQIISFVTDGEGANQSIWHLTRNAPSKKSWTLQHLPEREPVGYYSWNHGSGDLIYWSRYGFSIRLTHQSKPVYEYASGDAIPTTPWVIPDSNRFSFLFRKGNGEVWIMELDPKDLSTRPLVPVSGPNNHYNWSPDRSILMIQNDQLLRWRNADVGLGGENKGSWEEVADLGKLGIQKATRLAVSPDKKWLAIVGQPVK